MDICIKFLELNCPSEQAKLCRIKFMRYTIDPKGYHTMAQQITKNIFNKISQNSHFKVLQQRFILVVNES